MPGDGMRRFGARALRANPLLWVSLVYLVGVGLRALYTFGVQPPEAFVTSDMYFYVSLARKFAAMGGPVDPWDVTHPLGYPVLLQFLMSSDGSLGRAAAFQFVVSCLVPGAVGLLGAAAYGRRTGLLAVVFASLYFPFIEYGALFLSEIHFIFWLALAFAALFAAHRAARRGIGLAYAAAAGLSLSLAAAFKSVALPAAFMFCVAEAVGLNLARPARRPAEWLAAMKPWAFRWAVIAVAATPVLGLLARKCTGANHGRFCVTGNKVGSDFLLGHYGRIAAVEWEPEQVGGLVRFGSPGAFLRHYDDVPKVPFAMTDNAANNAEAWRWIAAHPGEAILLSLDHVYDTFFGVAMWPGYGHPTWPFAHLSQYLFVVLLFIPALLACTRLARRGLRVALSSRTALVLAPILAVAITVAIATGEVRYRIPFDTFFIVLVCAYAVRDLARVDGLAVSPSETGADRSRS
jgi:hypothetical protein